ncbi:MAG: hypothetical protein KY466_09145 [Gemmatimonadetes bacterium]|nr:hypothetical protein [Gemmatimonadota bacterium]
MTERTTDGTPDATPDGTPERKLDRAAAPELTGLPDAPLFALLRIIAERVGIDRIDRVWLFPPRRLKAGETSVVVVGAYAELDDHRRRVYAAHYTAPADANAEARLALDEFGTAPADRVGRVVEEVVERIKEDAPPQPPRAVSIDGDEERWTAMLHELAEQFLAEASENPRLGR